MSARELVAAALGEAFDDIEVIDTFTTVGEREPGAGPFIQVFTDGFLPSGLEGILRARFKVWFCVDTTDSAEVEDELEQLLPTIVSTLDGLNWLEWTEINPGRHPDNYYGYEATITTVTDSIS